MERQQSAVVNDDCGGNALAGRMGQVIVALAVNSNHHQIHNHFDPQLEFHTQKSPNAVYLFHTVDFVVSGCTRGVLAPSWEPLGPRRVLKVGPDSSVLTPAVFPHCLIDVRY